jgi:peptide deformylase
MPKITNLKLPNLRLPGQAQAEQYLQGVGAKIRNKIDDLTSTKIDTQGLGSAADMINRKNKSRAPVSPAKLKSYQLKTKKRKVR